MVGGGGSGGKGRSDGNNGGGGGGLAALELHQALVFLSSLIQLQLERVVLLAMVLRVKILFLVPLQQKVAEKEDLIAMTL